MPLGEAKNDLNNIFINKRANSSKKTMRKKIISMCVLIFGMYYLFLAVNVQAASNISIYDIDAYYVASEKFDIIWTTNGSYDCTVIYSLKDGNLDDDGLVATRDANDYIFGSNFSYANSSGAYYYKLELTNQGDSTKFFNGNKAYYNIICYDQDRNKTTSSVNSIDIKKISNVETKNITVNSATVEWNSNLPDVSYILYGTVNSDDLINQIAKDSASVTSHKLLISSLAPGTKYYFKIYTDTSSNHLIESTVYSFTTTVVVDDKKYPGFAIEPVKKVFQSNENLVVNLRRLDGVNLAYLVDLWAQKVVPTGDAKKYQIQINTPVGNSNYVTTNDIDQMTVFTEGGNGEYSLATCPPTGCVMGATNSISVKIEGFKDVEIEEPKLEPTQETKKPTTDTQLTDINNSAKSLNDGKISELLSEIKQLRNELREQAAELKYLKSFAGEMKALTSNMQSAIKTFITYGVDENTKKLGEGERAAVVNSYEAAFDKLPSTEAELADAIKIANGRFPSLISDKAEKLAKEQFIKIYKRVADLNDANDNAAIKVMAYGLRQKAENRNLNSEKSGIKTFKAIYGYTPKTTEDWNTMQAITYSGAAREKDSDGDLLSDEMEAQYGTNPNKADTDGDGYKDGTEVNGGFDPLKK